LARYQKKKKKERPSLRFGKEAAYRGKGGIKEKKNSTPSPAIGKPKGKRKDTWYAQKNVPAAKRRE